jgi:hypothetical protein
VPNDLADGGGEVDVGRYNVGTSATGQTYTFGTGLMLYRPFVLEHANTGGSTVTNTLTPPGGYTLFSLAKNTSITSFTTAAGGTSVLTFFAVSSSVINVIGDSAPLAWIEEMQLTHPHQVDGTGATMNTTASAATYGHATFTHSADKDANYAYYRVAVPHDFDSSVDLQASFAFRLGGSDTGKHRYVISMADVADSASSDTATLINPINLDFAGDASGASNDRETIAYVTLTDWRTSLTAGHGLLIRVARDGDDGTNDTSTVNSADVNLKIKMGHTQ